MNRKHMRCEEYAFVWATVAAGYASRNAQMPPAMIAEHTDAVVAQLEERYNTRSDEEYRADGEVRS